MKGALHTELGLAKVSGQPVVSRIKRRSSVLSDTLGQPGGNLQSENFGLDLRVGHENTYHGWPYPRRCGETSLNRVVFDSHNDGK